MSPAASIRPDSWDLPLFLHVLGAMVLVGGLALVAVAMAGARREGSVEKARLGFRTLLFAVVPGYLVMRGAAEWIASKEHVGDLDPEPAWVGIGYGTGDLGFLLIVISLIVGGIGLRRARRSGTSTSPGGGVTAILVIVSLLLVAYVVAIWAMTTKPV